jgi:hypothetical protein
MWQFLVFVKGEPYIEIGQLDCHLQCTHNMHMKNDKIFDATLSIH